MLIIKSVKKRSLGKELGLKAGDKILSFNGFEAEDILDYVYYDASEGFTLTVEQEDGVSSCEIEKDADESLGLTFESDNLVTKT